MICLLAAFLFAQLENIAPNKSRLIDIIIISTFKIESSISSLVNPRVFVGAAVAAFAVIVGIVAFSGQSFINDITEDGLIPRSPDVQRQVLPLEIELQDIIILEVTDTAAFIETKFKVTNPNYKSVILQYIKYELYEDDLRVSISDIGERTTGFVAGSNYFTILNEAPTILTDKITIKNTGNTPEFWTALKSNTPKWKIKGEAFFNLSSMISGGEQEIKFEFIKQA